jgi:hypothetical protein
MSFPHLGVTRAASRSADVANDPLTSLHLSRTSRCRESITSLGSKSIGAAGGIRTPDPRFRRPMLYPLSYSRSATIDIASLTVVVDPFNGRRHSRLAAERSTPRRVFGDFSSKLGRFDREFAAVRADGHRQSLRRRHHEIPRRNDRIGKS